MKSRRWERHDVEFRDEHRMTDPGLAPPKVAKKKKAPLILPQIFQDALEYTPRAHAFFRTLSYDNKKAYIDWINAAQQEEKKIHHTHMALEYLEKGMKNPGDK